MTAKEYLSQIRRLDTLIKIKKDEVEDLRARVENCSIRYDSDGSSCTSRDVHKQERLYVEIADLDRELEEDISKLINKRSEVLTTVQKLCDSNEIQVLYCRYFEYERWEEIAIEMHYTYRQILRIHGRALQHLEEIMSHDVTPEPATMIV